MSLGCSFSFGKELIIYIQLFVTMFVCVNIYKMTFVKHMCKNLRKFISIFN